MKWIKKSVLFLAMLLSATVLWAQTDSKTLYIYQDGNVLVNETRTLELTRGSQNLELKGLPDYFDFESLMLRLNGRVQELRWSMPESKGWNQALKSFIGKQITLEHSSGQRISGTLVFAEPGSTVIRLADGTQILIHNLDGYTINGPSWDLSTNSRTVTAKVEPNRAGRQPLSMSYFTPGLAWNNRYMLVVSEDDRLATFSGFTHIRNTSDQSFENVDIRLVAGSLNRRKEMVMTAYSDAQLRGTNSMSASMSLDPEVSAAAFGDLQLFSIAGKHSLAKADQVRIPLLSADGVQVQKRYRFTSLDRNLEFPQGGLVQVHYDIQNTSRNKLGQAVPNGVVSLYRMNQGQPVMIGEDTIGNIARDGVISVNSGSAFDILVKETISNQNRISDRIMEYTIEVVMQNRKSESVTVELERNLNPNQAIVRSGQPFKQRSARHQFVELTIPAGADLTFEFTIRNER